MRSPILHAATRLLMPLLLVFALFLLLRGHNAPGGGFVAGLVVAAAFVLYSIDSGVAASRRALPLETSTLFIAGLLIALASGLPALATGQPFMTPVWATVGVPGAMADLGTPLLFDAGVFLTVIGVVLTMVFTLADVVLSED